MLLLSVIVGFVLVSANAIQALEGYRCERSKYGCCGDEITSAKGPDMAGCDCSNSKYGCCPDGKTEAGDDNFQNCLNVPINKQAACALDSDKGPCRNFTNFWYYDMQFGECSQFWYGGCEGNGNRFVNKAECEDVCVRPSPKDSCNLPKVKAICGENHVRWYYNSERKQCSQFVYGGCLGNNNNFDTKEICQERCEPEKTEDKCNLALERGPCAGNFARWGFSAERRRCEQFVWGGCGGNQNRYDSEAACQLQCAPHGKPQHSWWGGMEDRITSVTENEITTTETTESDISSSAESTTNNGGTIITDYSGTSDRLDTSSTGGLEGYRCERSKYGCCGDETTAAKGPDMAGCDCSNSKYGCCPDGKTEAGDDNFLNCSNVPINKQAACALDSDKGPCRNFTNFWYYDMQFGECSQFWYGGCEGNGNRFVNKAECEDVCVRPSPKDSCNLPKVKAICGENHVRWYYNSERKQCSQFVYGGCLGNNNNFDTKEICQERCEPEKTEDKCNLALERGPCAGNFARWGFSAERRRCEQFVWGGCGGNQNRYDSEAACQLQCAPHGKPQHSWWGGMEDRITSVTENEITTTETTESDISSSAESTTNNGGTIITDYSGTSDRLDTSSTGGLEGYRCERSKYGCCGDETTAAKGPDMAGCDCSNSKYGCCPDGKTEAGDDNFLNCSNVPINKQAACALDSDKGPCRNFTNFWYYDMQFGECSQFWYGGCEGNGNRFVNKAECEDVCVRPSPKDSCNLPKVKAICGENHVRWYYNSERKQCSQFVYGGCLGNNNNFDTKEICQERCEPEKTEDKCNLALERGPCAGNFARWGFSAERRRCEQFVWGGCGGNQNRYDSEAACQLQCAPHGKPQHSWWGGMEDRITSVTENEITTTETTESDIFSSAESTTNNGGTIITDYSGTSDRLDTSSTGGLEGYRCERSKYGCCGDEITSAKGPDMAGCDCSNSKYGCCPDGKTEAGDDNFQNCSNVPINKQAACALDSDKGPCRNYTKFWYFDMQFGECSQFWYGGCEGNGNRFVNKADCENVCVRPSPKDSCNLPKVKAICGGYHVRWYYNSERKQCSQFVYGGCLGNNNNFDTKEICQERCEPEKTEDSWWGGMEDRITSVTENEITTTETTESDIFSSAESTTNNGGTIITDYSGTSDRLDTSSTGGLEGYRCERSKYGCCGDEITSAKGPDMAGCDCSNSKYGCCPDGKTEAGDDNFQNCSNVPINKQAACALDSDKGPCRNYTKFWYFDMQFGECSQFWYGGCEGNGNRFVNKADCENVCVRPSPKELFIPSTCEDYPYISNCNLIVRSKFCYNKLFSIFCCKSCVEAGQLDVRNLQLQINNTLYRK